MNTSSEKDILNSVDKINKLYDKLTYLDIYGNSVVLFIIITLFVFLVHSYCIVMVNAQAIKDDWVNQRCNPRVMPFAGFINKPDNKNIVDFTGENFNYCIQNVLTNITGFALQPFNYLINGLTEIFNMIQTSINTIREFMAKLRTNVQNIAEETLNRILNIMIPLQQMFIGIKDAMGKVEGILTAGLYTTLGAYYALKSLMGAIVQMIIIILIILAVIIIGLWLFPLTWSMAITLTAVFIGVSIPLAILVIFMTEVLHIQTEGIPGLPSPSCFDKNTMFQMNDGSLKPIIDINVGDILYGNNKVTAKIKATSKGQQMYKLKGILVSGTHIVKYNHTWIPVKLHPDIERISIYEEPFLYCLNTLTKTIILNDIIFTDWDEIYEEDLDKILKHTDIQYIKNIPLLYKGFTEGTKIYVNNLEKPIEHIEIGDKIFKDIVYGIVELGTLEDFDNNNLLTITNDLSLRKSNIKIYHLLTNSRKFTIGDQVFHDYNFCIDSILYK